MRRNAIGENGCRQDPYCLRSRVSSRREDATIDVLEEATEVPRGLLLWIATLMAPMKSLWLWTSLMNSTTLLPAFCFLQPMDSSHQPARGRSHERSLSACQMKAALGYDGRHVLCRKTLSRCYASARQYWKAGEGRGGAHRSLTRHTKIDRQYVCRVIAAFLVALYALRALNPRKILWRVRTAISRSSWCC